MSDPHKAGHRLATGPTLCKVLGSDLLDFSMAGGYGLVGQCEADSVDVSLHGGATLFAEFLGQHAMAMCSAMSSLLGMLAVKL